MTESINLIPLLVSIAIYMAIGMFWYSPKLFGKMWARANRIDVENLYPSPFSYGGTIIVAGITSWVIGMIIHAIQPASLVNGIKIGFYCWLGFVATTQFSSVIWAKRSLRSYIIDCGCFLVSYVLIAALYTLWK